MAELRTADLTEIHKQVARFASLAKLDKSGESKLALLPSRKGLRLSLFQPEGSWHEPAQIPADLFPELEPGLGYWLDGTQWLQILKGFGKKGSIHLERKEDALLFQDDNSRESLPLTIEPYPETSLVPTGRVQTEYRLNAADPQTAAALRRLSKLGADSLTLPGMYCQGYSEGLELLAGDGTRLGRLRIPADCQGTPFQRGVFRTENSERLALALEADPELHILCEADAWVLRGTRLYTRIPFQPGKWPTLGFLAQEGGYSFTTRTKELKPVLKALVPPAEQGTELAYRLETTTEDRLRFSWAAETAEDSASHGEVALQGTPPEALCWKINRNVLQDVLKLLTGDTWTWTLLENRVLTLRIQSENLACWFCPLLDQQEVQAVARSAA